MERGFHTVRRCELMSDSLGLDAKVPDRTERDQFQTFGGKCAASPPANRSMIAITRSTTQAKLLSRLDSFDRTAAAGDYIFDNHNALAWFDRTFDLLAGSMSFGFFAYHESFER